MARTPSETRIRRDFAAFAHAMRHACEAGVLPRSEVWIFSDSHFVFAPEPGLPFIEITANLVEGHSGLCCFIHCSETDLDITDKASLIAVFRSHADGEVSRYPEPSNRHLGYLADSEVAGKIARILIRESRFRRGFEVVDRNEIDLLKLDSQWSDI